MGIPARICSSAVWISLSILAIALLALCTSDSAANTWSVPTEISSIQVAIDTASYGDTIIVAAGLYQERLQLLDKSVVLIGDGYETTTLSGVGFPKDGQSLFYASNPGTSTVITGFTFEDAGDSTSWGAFRCETFTGSVTPIQVTQCRFRNNFAISGGGVLAWSDVHLTLTECLFEDNTALLRGGSVYVIQGAVVTISNNIFIQNRVIGQNQVLGVGGALDFNVFPGSGSMVSNNIFFRNEADYGGAINLDSSDATIHQNTIVLNRANWDPNPLGAGIRMVDSNPTITNNIVALNEKGDGIQAQGSSFPVLDCNDVWGNARNNYVNVTPGPTGFSKNPQLCDPVAGDLDLALFSPCLPESTNGCGLVGARGVGCSVALGTNREEQHGAFAVRAVSTSSGRGVDLVFQSSETRSDLMVDVEIFNALGQSLGSAMVALGVGSYRWDGRTQGRMVASGVYFVRATLMNDVATTSFVILR